MNSGLQGQKKDYRTFVHIEWKQRAASFNPVSRSPSMIFQCLPQFQQQQKYDLLKPIVT